MQLLPAIEKVKYIHLQAEVFTKISSIKSQITRANVFGRIPRAAPSFSLSMNHLGAPVCHAEASERRLTSRRPVGSRKPKLAGETPALPGAATGSKVQSAKFLFR
jgi:hypothetical protein